MMLIQEETFERRGDQLIGISGPQECYEIDGTVGQVYNRCLAEHGRCISKIYHEKAASLDLPVGWCFEKRVAYQDDPSKTYLQETWVTLHSSPPTRSVEGWEHPRSVINHHLNIDTGGLV